MKILLIGKNGQIGTEIDSQTRQKKYNIKSFSKKEFDITRSAKVKSVLDDIKPDAVINTAAYHVVAKCEQYPQRAFDINAIAVRNLAALCSERKIKLIHFSTSWVFDGQNKQPYLENEDLNPIQTYGLSKAAGEIFSLNYNPDTIIVRTCGVFGGMKGSRSKKGNFILSLLREAKTKKGLAVSSEQITSITNARDIALATLQLLESKVKRGTYHLVNTGACSWLDVARKIVKFKKLKLQILPIDRKGTFRGVKIPINSSLENEKAKQLGITLPPWENALKQYLESL